MAERPVCECDQSPEVWLESGLGKLSGFKKLREIDLSGVETRIDVKEVQWMVANWPRLRYVYGLWEADARSWLQENAVNVQLE